MKYDKSDLAALHDVIVQYLQNNPNAADSLEGIMRCWLPPAYKKTDTAKIEQALSQLILKGLVEKILLADGTILYRKVEESNKN